MSQNKQRLSWLEMLKVNQRAYLLFYKRYPRMILSRFALIIWKALTPYVGIYFSALIIEELAGAKNPGRIRFLVYFILCLCDICCHSCCQQGKFLKYCGKERVIIRTIIGTDIRSI